MNEIDSYQDFINDKYEFYKFPLYKIFNAYLNQTI